MTVALPKAAPVGPEHKAAFADATAPLLQQMAIVEASTLSRIAAAK
jgi:hypothetical protein